VSVSGVAQLITLAQAEVAQVPEVRTDKVEALRAAIDSDRYHPDGKAVADGIVREHMPTQQVQDVGT
jgi:flagellar biosynthesis anti-sigma factor FlgM